MTAKSIVQSPVGVFVLALALRLIHLFEIVDQPWFAMTLGDALAYDEWAREIAGGDGLGDRIFYQAPLYPYFLAAIYALAGHDLLVVRIVQALLGSAACALLVPTGIALAIPVGFEGQDRPRSGLAIRHGVTLPNAPGTIDADYRGEVKVILANHGDAPVTVRRGDRIAQLVIQRVPEVDWVEVEALPDTERGSGGFGHTGTD